jgi:hypothetical protein
VGYTSGRVLAGVLVENGVIGGLGGVLGMILGMADLVEVGMSAHVHRRPSIMSRGLDYRNCMLTRNGRHLTLSKPF